MDEVNNQRSPVIILANGGRGIGWGHIMRCCSIGRAVSALGGNVLFVVMNSESGALVSSFGFEYRIVDIRSLKTESEADIVSAIIQSAGARFVLVDSYDVSEAFFNRLSKCPFSVGYIDDLYVGGIGELKVPCRFNLELLVNYGFGFTNSDYAPIYSEQLACCLIGPRYAPVRSSFSRFDYSVEPKVNRILLTTGSTNPNRSLERMILACGKMDASLETHVIVGENASLDNIEIDQESMMIHTGVCDLSELMFQSDIVVSSAGSTLYELACMGVPTIALPVVQNQLCNARGFYDRKLGYASLDLGWTESDVASMLKSFVGDFEMRKSFSLRMRKTVDGNGAKRIAEHLIELAKR